MSFSLTTSYTHLQTLISQTPSTPLPSPSSITTSTSTIITTLPPTGLGPETTSSHLLTDLTPGFNGPKTSSTYYGFVTGGVFPIAELADNIVTAYDQNVQVHLPEQSISTVVEDAALRMVLQLVGLEEGEWEGRTFTTGATASNVLGLACGREAVLGVRLRACGVEGGVGELGVLNACLKGGVKGIQVLTAMGHSSLYKAASVVGIGRAEVKDLPVSAQEPWKLDVEKLRVELERAREEGVVSIVAVGAGEVNTGRFAVGRGEMEVVRRLCDEFDAWLHVDAAFGLFARALPKTSEFKTLHDFASIIDLADSIAGDCHKMLNVPYDSGIFFTRTHHQSHLTSTFQNPNAIYLSSSTPSTIPSPLNIGLENSRRFRALPVYAVLLTYGLNGLSEIFANQVRLARSISKYINESEEYELLPREPEVSPKSTNTKSEEYMNVHVIVLFSAKDEKVNKELISRINKNRKIYVSGTRWEGREACRIAVGTWMVDGKRDLDVVRGVLSGVLEG